MDWGTDVGAAGGSGVGLNTKSHPSEHKYNSPKKFLLIAYLKTSGLNGSKRTQCKPGATSLSRF